MRVLALHDARSTCEISQVAEALPVAPRDRTFIIGHAEQQVTPQQLEKFRKLTARRAKREPSQYITGHQAFYGLEFDVTADVLIPRPETELLVETALGLIDQMNGAPLICDVGTGSGCIAIALLHERPLVHAVALDVSPAALNLACATPRGTE